ncbi:MAG TPA: molybdenum ABC transporter ATP-binding protein [Ramlibacter sp.]|nr:molybdenum ABC transporter ATP-binding protein [Ramlibacter sp.]
MTADPVTTNRIRLKLPRADYTLDIDLELPHSGITGIFGPSGAGKTSVLRCVAGLDRAQPGIVRIAGETWQDEGAFVPAWKRAVGYVFQEASLFDHFDVRGNVEYGRKRAGGDRASLDAAIELLGIAHLLDRRPASLSGGERQRVAIARAVASAPQLMLLDEPLAALDTARRHEILPWLARLRDELELPMLYVTHSIDEIARLADTVVLLDRGRVNAHGPARDVLGRIDASAMLGDEAGALLEGRVAQRDDQWQLALIAFDGGQLWLRDSGIALGRGVRLRVLARDVSIATHEPQGSSIQNTLAATIAQLEPDVHPSQVIVQLRCGDSLLLARITARAAHTLALEPGQRVWAQVKSVALVG